MGDHKKSMTKVPEDLKGFEDIIDDFSENDPSNTGSRPAAVESMTFLQNDTNRLKKINNLMSKKVPFLKQYPQSMELVRKQKKVNEELYDKVAGLLTQPASTLNLSLAEIFNHYFGH